MDGIFEQAMVFYHDHKWAEAEALFVQVEDQEKVASYLKKCRVFRNYSVGSTVPFGSFADKEILWQVLEERGNMRLLVSRDIVTTKAYQELYVDTCWENATLRKWLNKDFIAQAFSKEEQRSILNVRIDTPANEDFFTNGGPKTMDKVFILSKPEIEKYMPTEEQRNLGSWWWIRTPGSSLLSTSIVYSDGSYYRGGVNVNSNTGGVRPAMWILLKG